ncbi:GntR family transcriptional regulator [Adlercreutzia sp. ZJ242]|uniref:GntR family transcriptional regulator n=1 Tax=Adlercreutzia sp. ZJ242 TaxID=2709409 RepID=UPI0013EA6368|nr:GntR family transcriptional regulator [Adlercreutzia sp. ZJ242]
MFPFEVDEQSDLPLWVQLRQRLIYLINSGYFKPGDQLPTVRGLASDISINYNTVNKAYLSLVSDGYLESARGRGVFVRDLAAEVGEEFGQDVEAVMDEFINACRDLGLSYDDMLARIAHRVKQRKFEEAHAAQGDMPGGRGRIVEVEVGVRKGGDHAAFGG